MSDLTPHERRVLRRIATDEPDPDLPLPSAVLTAVLESLHGNGLIERTEDGLTATALGHAALEEDGE